MQSACGRANSWNGNDLDLLLNFLAEFIKYCSQLKPKQKQINAWIDKGSSNPQWLWKHLDSALETEVTKEEPKAEAKAEKKDPPAEKTEAAAEPKSAAAEEEALRAEQPPHPAEEEKKEEKPTVTDEQQKAGSPWAF